MTHCGFGGTCEFMSAGVPVLTFPHFTDQTSNAKKLVESGAAIQLMHWIYSANRDFVPKNQQFYSPMFDSAYFA